MKAKCRGAFLLRAIGAVAISRRADGRPVTPDPASGPSTGRTAKIAPPDSKQFELIAHRVPEPDIKRLLRPLRLHRQLCLPLEPLTQTDRLDTRHDDLGRIGFANANRLLASCYGPPPQYSLASMIVSTRRVTAGLAGSAKQFPGPAKPLAQPIAAKMMDITLLRHHRVATAYRHGESAFVATDQTVVADHLRVRLPNHIIDHGASSCSLELMDRMAEPG